jgi:hypothetical protein
MTIEQPSAVTTGSKESAAAVPKPALCAHVNADGFRCRAHARTGRTLCHLHGLDREQRKQLGRHAGKRSGTERRLRSCVGSGLLPLDVVMGVTPEHDAKLTKGGDGADDVTAANALTELYYLRHGLMPDVMPTQVRHLFLDALQEGLDFDTVTFSICKLPKGTGPRDVVKRARMRARGQVPGPGPARQ